MVLLPLNCNFTRKSESSPESLSRANPKHKNSISQLKSDNNCFFENFALKFISHSRTPGSKMVSLTAAYAYNLPISC